MQTCAARDHPRACGEKLRSPCRWSNPRGSPPRVRGKANYVQGDNTGGGITPARAGKSPSIVEVQLCARDHPRACGEKIHSNSSGRASPGSPPRVRGKERWQYERLTQAGITPARAGKRPLWPWGIAHGRDHPRACGEKKKIFGEMQTCAGSPPRVRGKGQCTHLSASGLGITPARAGKRLKHIPYLLFSCAKHLFTPQFCVDNLCQLAVGYSAVSLNIR